MTEKYQVENPNAHYLANLDNLNLTNNNIQLGRLPTLGEILSNKTKQPINLYNFYLYMKLVENNVDYLDFWFDLINHLNLCKHYVKGLRESILHQSAQGVKQTQGPAFGSNNPFSSPHSRRNSGLFSDQNKHKSISLSVLLELIINDHILEDNDSNRLSEFLRGDINLDTVDPKLRDMIQTYNAEGGIIQPSPLLDNGSFQQLSEKRISSQSRLMDDQQDIGSMHRSSWGYNHDPTLGQLNSQRYSTLNPSMVERLIKDASTSENFISRQSLKDSSHNLILKYFVEDSEKSLGLPQKLNDHVVRSIEIDGRDDPDVFTGVKRFVFSKLENEYLPSFLNFVAIKNVTHSVNSRIIVGFIFIFISFWIGFTLIFLNEAKRFRCVVILTFFCGFYALVLSIYRIDPILAFCKRSESFVPGHLFIRVEDSFIFHLLLKRSAWVLTLVVLLTAVFSVIFCLVPGHRL